MNARWAGPFAASVVLGVLAARTAGAYPHVVQKGETLAQISERAYGLVEYERVLVVANGLDANGGLPIVPGLRLEVPALAHQRVAAGDTWATLATSLLGDPDRSDVLSMANDSSPWLTPAEGAEIVVPYNLRVVLGQSDSLVSIAQRFMGNKEKAWVLAHYNRLGNAPQPKRGDTLLVPLTNLPLTPEARSEAAQAQAFERSEAAGMTREVQKKVDAELPALVGDVRSGRYVDAIARGAKMLSAGELARPQLASIHRQMLEAYAALDAPGLAFSACRAWREADPVAPLDPIYLSPKLLAACESSGRAR